MKFQPYLGSRKGSHFTLQQLAGNDTDQASLLIALLRAAGVPSRYVRGSVEITAEQAMNWLGVEDARTAGSILTTAGLDGLNIVDGVGNVTAIRCTRVWVEAFIPYSNYRGIPNDNTGKIWIPLDPAYTGTRSAPGEDVLALMGWDADAFLADYISTFQSPSPNEKLLEDVQAWLDINRPGQTVADIERTIALDELELGLLPASLPYQARSITSRFSTLEDAKRYKVRFHLLNGGTTLIDHTVPLLHLVGHRLTIEYLGATPTDQAIIDSYGSIYETPPNLVQVKPLLKLDDVPIATSVNSIGMGRTHSSDMHFLQPAGASNVQPLVSNDIIAGNGQAIAFDSFLDVHDFLLAPPDTTRGNYFEELMYESAVDYLGLVDQGQRQAERLLRVASVQDVSEAIVENSVKVTTSFGVPLTFEWTGLIVDADRRIVGPFPVDGNDAKTIPYMKLTGYDGSFMEQRIFEDNFNSPAVSTIRAFHVSVQQGIPLCTITSSIGAQCPGFSHSPAVTAAVNDALARGNIIIIPRTSVTYEQWVGTGYINMDPSTGAAGYIISGGINGNVTVSGGAIVDWLWPIFPPCLAWPWNVQVEIIQPASDTPDASAIFSGCDDSKIEFKFRVTATSCFFGGDPGPVERVRRTNLTKKQIADRHGGGDYVLTMSSLFSTPVTRRITIVKPNLVVQGLREEILPPPNELNPGACVGLNANNSNENLVQINLSPGVGSLTTGQLTLVYPTKLRVFAARDTSGPEIHGPWSPTSMPLTLYLDGKTHSSTLGDASLTLRYQSGSVACQDLVTVTVVKVESTNIKFNHDTGSSAGNAINIRQDYSTPIDISNGEWIRGGANQPVAYTANNSVTIKARFTVQPNTLTSAVIWAVSTDSDGSLGDVVKTPVAFSGGISVGDANGYVLLPISGNTPNAVKKSTTDTWQWKAENINGASVVCDFDVSGPHTIYTLLNEPMTPWINTSGNQRNAWINALEFAVVTCNAGGSANEDAAMQALTTHLYTIPYNGASQCLTFGGTFSYTSYMTTPSANCLDSAVGLDTTGSLLGMDMVARRRTEFFGFNFHCFAKKGAYVYDSTSAMSSCILKMDYATYIAAGTPGPGSIESNETYPIE